MPRPQFTLKTMLWVMLCAACFLCAGIRFERYLAERRADAMRSQITSDSDWWPTLAKPGDRGVDHAGIRLEAKELEEMLRKLEASR